MRLIIILGDQLNHTSPALEQANPDTDVVVMTEAHHEATYIWQHKKRLVLFFAAMRHFAEALRKRGFTVVYNKLDDTDAPKTIGSGVRNALGDDCIDEVLLARPGDYRVLEVLEHIVGQKLKVIDDTHFMTTPAAFQDFLKDRKRIVLEDFYRLKRKETGWLINDDGKPEGGQWNFDKDNRETFSNGQSPLIPERVTFAPDAITQDVVKLVNAHFPDSPGTADDFCEAVTREQALTVLDDFIDNRLQDFGPYQDAMTFGQQTLYHSRLSACMNLRLISAREVCETVLKDWKQRKLPINSVEGFLRQVIGWREFVHGLYWAKMPDYADHNALGATLDVPDFFWTGDTDMACLRDSLTQLVQHGYAHHIKRLMIMGLFLMMYGAHPYKAHEWHISLYLDAIDWVSLPNVLGMSQFGDGGIMGTKPYCATGAYVNRMGPYCKECRYDPKQSTGDKACPFTTLYWDFLARHEEAFSQNARMRFQMKNLERKSSEDVAAIRKQAETVRNGLQ